MNGHKNQSFDTFFEKDIEKALKECFKKNGTLTLFPKGTSMLPTLREGKDCVELSPIAEISKNGIYLYKRQNGKYVLHRLIKTKNSSQILIFSGDNQLVTEKVEKSQLLAQVTKIYRNNKDLGRGFYKISHKLFISLNSCFFIRRILIKKRAFIKRFFNPKNRV